MFVFETLLLPTFTMCSPFSSTSNQSCASG